MPKGVHLPRVEMNCERCGIRFSRVGSDNDRRYCSAGCKKQPPTPKMILFCMFCNAPFTPKSHRRKDDPQRWCSTSCNAKDLGQEKRNKRAFPVHKTIKMGMLHEIGECERCGFTGCTEILELHHVDRNPRNNSRNNLMLLCPNCHSIDHFIAKDGQFANNFGRVKKD